MERTPVPPQFDYHKIQELSIELREKLSRVRPVSVGQASRIPGMTPAALVALMVHVRRPQYSGSSGAGRTGEKKEKAGNGS
jgi:tRNA uridine 5-carboxymethylaminomethyl modification enzyme